MALDPQTIRRLAIIRLLYDQGVEQAASPEPLSAMAVLSFHDAVELFLKLAADYSQLALPARLNFLDYWTQLQPCMPAGSQLPSKSAMDRMNRLRVAFKHHGTIPSSFAIEQTRADVNTFLMDATSLIFKVSFTAVDLADLISRPETARNLRDAQTHADLEDFPVAMVGLMITFNEFVDYHSSHASDDLGFLPTGPLAFGPTIQRFDTTSHDFSEQLLMKVTRATAAIQKGLRIMALGIDYRRYSRFAVITPEVIYKPDGTIRYRVGEPHKRLNAEDYQFGRNFVIESALRAADAHSTFERWSQDAVVIFRTGLSTHEWNGKAK